MTSTAARRVPPPLPEVLVEPLVRMALKEDLGRAGDMTSVSTIPAETKAQVALCARDQGVIAGLQLARTAFRLMDPSLKIAVERGDGTAVAPGDVIAHVQGPARAILSAERVALNFMGHLSGIATATSKLVGAVEKAGPTAKARITCTRKTTPGLRSVEKHAVLCGGGVNHRFGLDDAILIKDNHIAIAGGVTAALEAAFAYAGHMTQIEIEVDTLDQLEEALSAGAKVVLLDNMSPEILQQAVKMTAGRAVLEASGRVSAETVTAIAATGVDYISSGAITHSAPCLDIGLDYETNL